VEDILPAFGAVTFRHCAQLFPTQGLNAGATIYDIDVCCLHVAHHVRALLTPPNAAGSYMLHTAIAPCLLAARDTIFNWRHERRALPYHPASCLCTYNILGLRLPQHLGASDVWARARGFIPSAHTVAALSLSCAGITRLPAC